MLREGKTKSEKRKGSIDWNVKCAMSANRNECITLYLFCALPLSVPSLYLYLFLYLSLTVSPSTSLTLPFILSFSFSRTLITLPLSLLPSLPLSSPLTLPNSPPLLQACTSEKEVRTFLATLPQNPLRCVVKPVQSAGTDDGTYVRTNRMCTNVSYDCTYMYIYICMCVCIMRLYVRMYIYICLLFYFTMCFYWWVVLFNAIILAVRYLLNYIVCNFLQLLY